MPPCWQCSDSGYEWWLEQAAWRAWSFPWPGPDILAILGPGRAAQLLQHTAQTRNQYPTTARPPPQPGRELESRRSYRYRATTHFTHKRNFVWPLTAAGCCVWCGWWHCPWSPAGRGWQLCPVRGAGRRGAAASCGPGGWRQERRGDQKYLSGEMARDGDGGAAGTLHQGSGGQCAARTLIILHTFYNSE